MPGDGLNTITVVSTGWGERGFTADAAGTTEVQFARGEEGRWVIVEADVYLNEERFDFQDGDDPTRPSRRDLFAVLTHEIGHVLGLRHICGDDEAPACADGDTSASVMYPFYAGAAQTMLTPDDVEGACFLYPETGCDAAPCPVGSVCTPDGCRVSCGDDTCAANEVCTSAGCRAALCVDGADRCVGALGDPCESDSQCGAGLCGAAAACTVACDAAAACPGGYTCRAGGECEPLVSVFGDPCSYGTDCLSGLCLESSGRAPTCTRACDAMAPCPGSMVCAPVEGRDVCRPARAEGCAVVPLDSPAAWWPSLLVLLFLLRRRHS